MPLEDPPSGLVIMCVDPEAVRGSRLVPQVFPRINKFVYRVTTQTEFEETVAQLYGTDVGGGTIDEAAGRHGRWPDRDGWTTKTRRWNPRQPTTNWSSSSTR
jgi:hypothetical protein